MTAFLFIPSSDPRLARRVDFANIASLFSEPDEPLPSLSGGRRVATIALLTILMTLGAVGDLVLIAGPDRLAAAGATPQTIMQSAKPLPPHQSALTSLGALL